MAKIISSAEAANLIKDGWSIAVSGFVGSGHPEALSSALEARFLNEGHPADISLMYSAGQGDGKSRGLNHFAHKGMLRRVIGGHWNWAPELGAMALRNEIEAYNLPQGTITHMYRAQAGKQAGVFTKVGLGTFVDPRLEGGRLNKITEEPLVELVELDGEEWLRYKCVSFDAVLLRGTSADEEGNISVEKEAVALELLAMAQAARSSGGIVIVQVERLCKNGDIKPRDVVVPGILVDYVVKAEESLHWQTYAQQYDPAFAGQERCCLEQLPPMKLDARKVIARRAYMELGDGAVVNLGIGIPEGVASVAQEKGRSDALTLTVEAGGIGGVPAGGLNFGAVYNAHAMLEHSSQFDFYDGGGLDACCLGFAQADFTGNVNVSKFNGRVAGCGGFINITQNTKKVLFCGTFTAGGLEVALEDGQVHILKEGRIPKFTKTVEQVTFSGPYAAASGKSVMYITERAVFTLCPEGMVLTEIAPGVDLEKDVLAHMEFAPLISDKLKLMPEELFIP